MRAPACLPPALFTSALARTTSATDDIATAAGRVSSRKSGRKASPMPTPRAMTLNSTMYQRLEPRALAPAANSAPEPAAERAGEGQRQALPALQRQAIDQRART